jgi:hypothetical protein
MLGHSGSSSGGYDCGGCADVKRVTSPACPARIDEPFDFRLDQYTFFSKRERKTRNFGRMIATSPLRSQERSHLNF